ncbi:periplasmic chaperone for outer membrane proteins Skp [Prevotella sp. tc2-28]|jgi:outer membrane protein|uniref:OmpH family outer membrane protein n=1 Tax=Prevotella sp. tc2-28 TaxID=1761888 RepID=UPI000899357D|nr:OmpH family outer membrane protein [Prevotella sp. tc2-28]SEA91209.1 periplasmic chaperone for outer membrane proteins Skp [Prevotella sp. tc2-28]
MKKYMFFAAAAIVALASCNNETPKMDEQPVAAENNAGGMKIAYVEVDSLMTQYEFCKEFTLILQKKSNNARNTLNQKGQALQSAMQNFQQKLNNNGFTSREQAEGQQAAIQRQQQSLQELQARLENELASETAKYNEGLRDSLQHFLAAYNKDKKYDLILTKQGDNILYANKRFDITNDVINGLNKHYKSTLKTEAKEEKK